jgi:hypothetical protein
VTIKFQEQPPTTTVVQVVGLTRTEFAAVEPPRVFASNASTLLRNPVLCVAVGTYSHAPKGSSFDMYLNMSAAKLLMERLSAAIAEAEHLAAVGGADDNSRSRGEGGGA